MNLLKRIIGCTPEKTKKDIFNGERCRIIIISGPDKVMSQIGKEAIAYYVDGHLFIQNAELGAICTSSVKKIDSEFGHLVFMTRNSKYVIQICD